MDQHEDATYTRRLSREIDAAHADYRPDAPQSSERLYEAFRAQARNIIWYRLTCEDSFLERDIAERAFMALKKFRGDSQISTWFYRLAQNEAKRTLHQRLEDRNRTVSLSDDEDGDNPVEAQLAARAIDHVASIDVTILRRGLPPEQAEVLALNDEGYSLEQIAEKLGKPLGTIRGRYRLAKEKMRRKIQK